MQIPFTTRQEICNWAARYTEEQREDRRLLEETIIGWRENIPSRGLLREELLQIGGDWMRTPFFSSRIDTPEHIDEITSEAFSLADDWEKLSKLKDIDGVGEVVASAILHLYDECDYPICSKNARLACQVGQITEHNWRRYVAICREACERFNVSMRKLDRALYKYGGGNSP